MAVISISLPDPLLRTAERLMASRGFSGRSEFVRACVRDFVAANSEPERAGPRSATVTLVYPEGQERQFSKLRHLYSDVIRSMMHGHGRDACVEVFVLEGPGARIREFVDGLRGTREALVVSSTYTDAWDAEGKEADASAQAGAAPRIRRHGADHHDHAH